MHPLTRVIQNSSLPALQMDALQTICILFVNLGSDFSVFIPMVSKVLKTQSLQHDWFDELVSRQVKGQPLLDSSSSVEMSVLLFSFVFSFLVHC